MDSSAVIALAGVLVAFAAVSVSLIGILVAGFSVWLAYRERAAGRHRAVFEKQSEAYQAILSALDRMNEKARDVFPEGQAAADWSALYERGKALELEYDLAYKSMQKYGLFIPAPLWSKFNNALSGWLHQQTFPVEYVEVHGRMMTDYLAARSAVRDALGVEQPERASSALLDARPQTKLTSYQDVKAQ